MSDRPEPDPNPTVAPRGRPLPQFPGYETLERLGRGGMGVVYKARNVRLDRIEALKVVKEDYAESADFRERFLREVRVAARVEHTNVVRILAAPDAGDDLVLAMEYIDGLSLEELVTRKGPLRLDHACAFARMAARGLQAAHDKGLVHRDIKPHNLMVTRDGVVKIVDFGLAKAAREQDERGLTNTGEMFGTVEFMPPEQADDAKSADIRADIYALGGTLYFLLTGEVPFPGLSRWKTIEAHKTQPAPPLATKRPEAPQGLAELVAKMLAKKPEDRPQTPGEVAELLRPFCERARPRPDRVGTLLAALHRDAADHAARLALADALEEAGQLEQAEVARLHARQLMRTGTKAELDRLCALLTSGVRPVVPEVVNSVGMRLALIPAGKFQMGSPKEEADRDANDEEQHEVELTRAFYLGVYPVTQGEYEAVMGTNPSYFSAKGGGKDRVKGLDTSRFPVEQVSWEDAAEFCRRLTEKERKEGKIVTEQEYRLPSEAEWEYSCRGGAVSYQTFHFGDSLSSHQANFNGNSPYGGASKGPYMERTCEVGSYQPNGYGLYDMHGNVWEWCADWYDGRYYATSPRRDPPGPPKGSDRVIRGGSWTSEGQLCRSAYRSWSSPSDRFRDLGLRVSLVPPSQ